MYLNPFWAGVCAAIVFEIMLLIVAAIINTIRNDNYGEDEIETKEIVLPPELEQKIVEEIERQAKEGNKRDGV